jgi:glycosyltransferase involved in cell wall biosynthesis
MPGAWPEPFGLVPIEALACATPLIARRIGALPEMVRDGIDGWFGDDVTAKAFRVDRVASLDRAAIRRSVLERFSAEAMATAYEDVYRRAAKVVPLVQRDREAAAVRDEAVATALGRGA